MPHLYVIEDCTVPESVFRKFEELKNDLRCAKAARDAAISSLIDMVYQFCPSDEDGVFSTHCLSAQSNAFETLVQLGLAEYAKPGFGRAQFIRMKGGDDV